MLPPLRACDWRQVVAALRACGVQVAKEDDYHIFVARHPYIKCISKRGPIPVSVQQDLLLSFGILRTEYLEQLPEAAPAN